MSHVARLVRKFAVRTLLSLSRRSALTLAGSVLSAVALVAAVITPTDAAVAAASAAPLQAAAGQYFPVTPVQALNTGNGTGGVPVAPMSANSTVTFLVAGVGQVPAGVSDVYVVLNAIGPTASGCLDDFDPDNGDTGICSATFDAGNNDTDSDIVQVSQTGEISLTNISSGTVGVVVTIMGYYQDNTGATAGETYVPLPLDQIVDTTAGLGAPRAQIPAGGTLTVQVTGLGGVPSDAAGAALYIGAKYASATGYVSAYPAGGASSSLSLLSYVPGQAVHDLYFGALSSSGQLTLWNHGSGPVDLMVAIQGYLASPTGNEVGSTYQDVPQYRLADTRNGTGGVPAAAVQAGGSITFTATGADGIPQTGVTAVAETIVAVNPTAVGFLSEYAAGTADPAQPGVNFYAGGNQGNGLTASLVSSISPTGQQTITNHSQGTVEIAVTVRGYYAAPTVPSAPDTVTATVSGSTATVTWGAPYGDGGSPITSYMVTAPPDSATVTVNGNTYEAVLTGLTNPANDTFEVSATNSAGTGQWQSTLDAVGSAGTVQEIGISAGPSTDPSTDPASVIDTNSYQDIDTATGIEEQDQAVTPDVSDINLSSSTAVPQALTGDAEAAAVNPNCGQYANKPAKVDGVVPKYLASFNNFGKATITGDGSKLGSVVISWLNKLYGVNNAADYQNQLMWLALTCASGGGHTNGSQLVSSLSEDVLVTNSSNSNTLQGDNWGKKVTSQDTVSTQRAYNLGASYKGDSVGLDASQTVTANMTNAEEQGDVGADYHLGKLYKLNSAWDANRIDIDWIAKNGHGDSTDMVGNVGVAYYWYPMSSGTHNFYSVAVIEACMASDRGNCIEAGQTITQPGS